MNTMPPPPTTSPVDVAPLGRPRGPARRRARRGWLLAIAALLLLLAGGFGLYLASGQYVYRPAPGVVALDLAGGDEAGGGGPSEKRLARLRSERDRLRAALRRKVPRGTYIVIDQTNNRLFLKKGDQVTREAVCSAGGGVVLRELNDGQRKREWVFDTPQGVFAVLQKVRDPVWKKPDWAFLEEGEPVPKNSADRFEYGMLGEFALYFGNGYMIHGTLYERLLGRSVTHGCIRLGRDDLREVFAQCPVGTPIYIF